MKALLLVMVAFVASTAFAARVAAPLPPPSSYADTESVTNVVFNAGVVGGNVFALTLELDASPSNNVEVAFGCDVNGDGALDDSEAAFAVGWDCGEWFFRDTMADVAGSCAGSCGRRKLDWNLRLGSSLFPKTLHANVGGVALPFPMTATMYDPSGNVARGTVRGPVSPGVAVKLGAMEEPLVIRIR